MGMEGSVVGDKEPINRCVTTDSLHSWCLPHGKQKSQFSSTLLNAVPQNGFIRHDYYCCL